MATHSLAGRLPGFALKAQAVHGRIHGCSIDSAGCQTPKLVMDETGRAYVEIGRSLAARGYRFTAVTPETHRLVLARAGEASSLEAIFGWNRPFRPADLDRSLRDLLAGAGALIEMGDLCQSAIRFATIGDLLFLHSGFPTTENDAVFFGPDTYRFVRLLSASLADLTEGGPLRLVDLGCGTGAGGIFASRLLPAGSEIVLSDINERALAFTAVNLALNGPISAQTVWSDVLQNVPGEADLIIANPPYLVDEKERLYRHGGGSLGIGLGERIVKEALSRLKPGGKLVLYTGAPVIAGIDAFFDAVQPLMQLNASQFRYEEIDPDVFGEELEKPAYGSVDRIAAVGLTAIKRG